MTPVEPNQTRVLTPPGSGAIGLIRIAGPRAAQILSRVFRSASHPASIETAERLNSFFDSNRLRYGRLFDADEVIDDVIVARVTSSEPPTFDISAHGGIRVVERILGLLEREGAPLRDASGAPETIWPHKNTIEREAIEALGQAKTARAVRFLAWQRKHLATRIEALVACRDTDPILAENELRGMMSAYRGARYLVDGASLAIVGPPNSGKSTLFNRLMGRSAAIVSPEAGTTRDWVTGEIELDGVPIDLIDTAGRREAARAVETEAISRGATLSRRADVCVLLLDGSRPLPADLEAMSTDCVVEGLCIAVANKVDLEPAWPVTELEERLGERFPGTLTISAQHGDGVQELERRVLGALGFEGWLDESPSAFAARQFDLMGLLLAACRACESADFARGVKELVGMFSDAQRGNVDLES